MSREPYDERREQEFMSAGIFVDPYGYVWQRLRNGRWRSTNNMPPRDYAQVHWADEPPKPWGPYIRVTLQPPVYERPQCCDLHNRYCEPLGDLCCEECSEAIRPEHPPGARCVLEEDR